MSSMKSTSKSRVSFGAPVDTIPASTAAGRNGGSAHWNAVAKHVTDNPGVWHPVTIGHLSMNGHRAAASAINAAGTDSPNQGIYAFRKPGYQAAFRDGRLYVRYDVPAEGSVTKMKRGAA